MQSFPADPGDPELTHWEKDPSNPLNVTNLPCGSRVKNSPGAFPGSIYQNGDHWNFLSFGYRFTTTDPALMQWRQVPEQFLSNASAKENGGQWTLTLPGTLGGDPPPPGSPTHMVSCGGGARFCLGTYDLSNETWTDAKPNASAGPLSGPPPPHTLCSRFALDWDVPAGDYNRNMTTRGLWQGCAADGNCPCQAACLADPRCDAWTVIRGLEGLEGETKVEMTEVGGEAEGNRCCLKSKQKYDPRAIPGSGWVTGVRSVVACEGGAAPAGANLVSYTDAAGSDAGWFTAGYASGGMGDPRGTRASRHHFGPYPP